MDFTSRQELFRVARDLVLLLEGRITRDSIERPGSDANILVNTGVAAGEEVVGQLIDVCAGQFLDSAEGDRLDRYVFDRYGLTRKEAASSLGTAVFSTSVATAVAFTIPQNTILSTAAGLQFITTLDTSFPAASTGPVFVPIRSVLSGADQQAAIGEITSIIGAIAGAPADLTVTNTVATAGAADAEGDESLRDRARRFFTTARRGTLGALEAGALAVPGVTSATAIESIDSLGRPSRFLQLVVTDRFTEALAELGTEDPSYDAQSQQLALQVFNALSDVRAGGVFVQVIVAQVILQQVVLQLTFTAGVDADVVALQARAVVVNLINQLAPGAQFDPAVAVEALRSVTGLIITGNEIASPVGPIVPNTAQVLRTTLALVTAGAVQGGQPIALTTNPDAFISGGATVF